MVNLSQILLAQSHDDGPIRFVGILIFIAIFIFGNVLQWWQKYQAQQRKLEAQRQAAAAATPQMMQRPTQRMASRPAGRARNAPGQTAQRASVGRRAIPGVRKLLASLPSVPGASLPPRRPTPPPTHPTPVRKSSQPRPAMAQPAHPAHPARSTPTAGEEITASQIGSRAPSAPTRADRIRTIFNARSLKQVYILTELLRPPLALRDYSTREA